MIEFEIWIRGKRTITLHDFSVPNVKDELDFEFGGSRRIVKVQAVNRRYETIPGVSGSHIALTRVYCEEIT